MRYRKLGKTALEVSEIGLGAEWLERHNTEEVKEVVKYCEDAGINILDCWMSEPKVRTNIGLAIEGNREHWIIQGHIGATWQDGQYVKSRKIEDVKTAFEDLRVRFRTDYIDLGMIHFVDEVAEFEKLMSGGDYINYVRALKKNNTIRHIGISTHNPDVAKLAALQGEIEMIMFSINPAFDMLPASEDINQYFTESYDADLGGIAPERAELYRICETQNIGITVMKGYAGGRLFTEEQSPFGVALTPVQCLHYALTRPSVASVMVGCNNKEEIDAAIHYEDASEEEKDYASVLANASRHAYSGQCTYCGHCAPCPVGMDIAMVNKLYDLALMQEDIPATVKAHYAELSTNAADCMSCGDCEKRCPFGVSVVERMDSAKILLG